MQDRIRAAVIGTGWWATVAHIPALREHPDVDLVGLCDVSPQRVQAAATAFGIERTYTDHRALLAAERPDAVVVATTHATHYQVAFDCLEAGAHVLVEKPMTLRAADARTLVRKSEETARALIVGTPANYMEHARYVQEWIASGRAGPIQLIQSVFNSFNTDLIGGKDRSDTSGSYPVHGPGDVYSRKEVSGGGHGYLQMSHAAGLLFGVTDLRIRSVQARMANFGLPLDLVDVLLVEFEGGALGTVSGTSNTFLYRSSLSIGCEQGSVEMDASGRTTTLRLANAEKEVLTPSGEADLRFAPVQNLIGIAQGREKPISTAEAGWRSVELLEAAYRSAESGGRAVSVEELYSEVDGD